MHKPHLCASHRCSETPLWDTQSIHWSWSVGGLCSTRCTRTLHWSAWLGVCSMSSCLFGKLREFSKIWFHWWANMVRAGMISLVGLMWSEQVWFHWSGFPWTLQCIAFLAYSMLCRHMWYPMLFFLTSFLGFGKIYSLGMPENSFVMSTNLLWSPHVLIVVAPVGTLCGDIREMFAILHRLLYSRTFLRFWWHSCIFSLFVSNVCFFFSH